MIRKCLYCEREFEAGFDTDAFCATYCQQAWWMYAGAGEDWRKIEPCLRVEWTTSA